MYRKGKTMFKNLRPFAHIRDIYCIDYEKLYKKGIRGFLFDIDNTLVHHGEDSNGRVDEFNFLNKMGAKIKGAGTERLKKRAHL